MSEANSLLEVAVIPILVGIFGLIGALLGPAIWGQLQGRNRGKVFENLILRELIYFNPMINPKSEKGNGKWTQHIQYRKFIHREIFQKVTENRDFILSLDPDFVYYVSQLWVEIEFQEQNESPEDSLFH